MTWTVLGESVAGTAHRARNSPCQDAFRFTTFGPSGEWLVVAAADGAGSASHAEIGSTLACEEIVRRVAALDPEALLARDGILSLLADVRNSLFLEAQRLDIPRREIACTALLAVVGPSAAAFAQVGDGAIIVGDGQGHRPVFWPEPGEYANATDFLIDDEFAERLLFQTVADPVADVAAFTDGMQRLALDFTSRTAHPGFFRPLFKELRDAALPEALAEPFRSFLDSPRVNERTDDDKTLVLAVRRP
jgi:hypothetical protein